MEGGNMSGTGWVDEVVSFWFEELKPEDWFDTKSETDEAIRTRFLDLHKRLREAMPASAFETPRAALAATLVYDQFPRNMFRGQARAFATDTLALGVARNALDRHFDQELTAVERQFLYMPFMHSEVIADQERSVMLFSALGRANNLKHARDHRDIVVRFGRFPHRNRTLGRDSTDDEMAFLEGHAGFGQ